MRLLTVQDIIDIQAADQPMQEPLAVSLAMEKPLEDVLAMPAREYMPCREQVLKENGLG